MNKKLPVVAPNKTWDSMKWVLVVVLFVGGLWANYQYQQVDWSLRLAGWIVLACFLLWVALNTAIGRKVWVFIQEARNELRKVVWPSRQQTIQTTLLIVALVVVMALLLWGIDSLLLWLTSLLMG